MEPVDEPQDEPVEEPGDLLQEGVPPAPLAVPAEGEQDTHGKAVPEPAPAPAPMPQPAPQPVPQG